MSSFVCPLDPGSSLVEVMGPVYAVPLRILKGSSSKRHMHMFQGKVQQKAHAYVTLMRITLILTSLDVLKCSLDMLMMARAGASHHSPTMGVSQKKHKEKSKKQQKPSRRKESMEKGCWRKVGCSTARSVGGAVIISIVRLQVSKDLSE